METAISVCDLVGWYLLQLPPQLEHELQRNSDDFKATAMRNMEEFGRYFNLQCLCRTRRRADGILAQTCLVRLKIKLASAAAPRKMIDQFPPEQFDAIITNAAGCGSHLKHYQGLLKDDPIYASKAIQWDQKIKDIHEWLGFH